MRRRSPWLKIVIVVLLLASAGVILIAVSDAGDVRRDLGVAVTSGGILGLVFVGAEAALAKHDELERLLLHLSLSQDLTGVNLRGKRLDDLALLGKPMAVADMSEGRFRRGKFVGADLRWSSLRGSEITDSVFALCNLDDVDLTDARLVRVSLRKASIRRSCFRNVTMEDVDLRGTDMGDSGALDEATFASVVYDDSTSWPSGFEPPPSTPAALQVQIMQPDWDEYWSQHP